ncbi:hypothetical protein [Campylobacter sp. JMF_08 NE1]|uniref:hypothetical protein n=1 Tax=Campylobacter sp. JMF_08 NE1 TaxID=2983821 RepID=UPI0022EA0AF5|nr:hypothetical protein [Campylobacter sp. JMF_08 NE1]MDA3048131.1 hypothetical protein [Campylobacter sp. JMF_08 NE1]
MADFIAKTASAIDGFINKHSQYVRPILGVVLAFLVWGVVAPVIRILANSFLIMFHQAEF